MTTDKLYKQAKQKRVAVMSGDMDGDTNQTTDDISENTSTEELIFEDSGSLDTTNDSELVDVELAIAANPDGGEARRRIDQLQEDRWLRSQIDYDF